MVNKATVPVHKRRRRIERPYGGVIVLTVPKFPESEAFCDRVEQFFQDHVPLPLYDGDLTKQAERDIDAVIAASKKWTLSESERRLLNGADGARLVYEPPRRPPVDGETFQSGAGIAVRAASRFIGNAHEPRAFVETETGGLALLHEEKLYGAEVEMKIDGAALETIKGYLQRFSPVTEDALMMLIANALNNEPDARGVYVVGVDDMLDGRGLAKKKTGKYVGAHHVEARIDMVEAVKDLATLFVATDPIQDARRKSRRLKEWVSVVQIERLSTLEDDDSDRLRPTDAIDPRKVVTIHYRLGPWLDGLREFQFSAPRAVLALDGKRESTAKKLGHYFVQRAFEADNEGRIVCQIRKIVHEGGTRVDGLRPQRSRDRFEAALNTLVQIGALEQWGYTVRDPNAVLPAYKWFEPWMELSVWVRLAN